MSVSLLAALTPGIVTFPLLYKTDPRRTDLVRRRQLCQQHLRQAQQRVACLSLVVLISSAQKGVQIARKARGLHFIRQYLPTLNWNCSISWQVNITSLKNRQYKGRRQQLKAMASSFCIFSLLACPQKSPRRCFISVATGNETYSQRTLDSLGKRLRGGNTWRRFNSNCEGLRKDHAGYTVP